MKTVVITGASGGIGSAAARTFAADGYMTAICYSRNADAAEAVRREIAAAGGLAFTVQADLTRPDEARSMIEKIIGETGRIDCLVTCAGIAQQKLFSDLSDSEWQNMLDCGLSSAANTIRAALPHMLRGASRGDGTLSIVTVSSIWGRVGASCEAHYSAAKAGIIGLTKALAKELGPAGIRVNCVAPGFIDTPMNAAIPDDVRDEFAESCPLGRIGSSDEVAAAIHFLASDAASFITGQVLGVDGGAVI